MNKRSKITIGVVVTIFLLLAGLAQGFTYVMENALIENLTNEDFNIEFNQNISSVTVEVEAYEKIRKIEFTVSITNSNNVIIEQQHVVMTNFEIGDKQSVNVGYSLFDNFSLGEFRATDIKGWVYHDFGSDDEDE